MKYGVCCGPDMAATVAAAGFDYFEGTVAGVLQPRESEDAFTKFLVAVRTAGLPCAAVNCFVPGDLKITGPTADLAALEAYVRTACTRGQQVGVQTIVFGSGGARRIPDGFDPAAAHRQIVAFCRMLGPVAQAHGITIAVEPLNRAECNVLTSVRESAELVREVGHPHVRLLVDAYHFLKDSDSLADVVAAGPLLVHAHVATLSSRLPPGAEPCDFAPFFKALLHGGFHGRMSIESNLPNPAESLPRALALLKRLERDSR